MAWAMIRMLERRDRRTGHSEYVCMGTTNGYDTNGVARSEEELGVNAMHMHNKGLVMRKGRRQATCGLPRDRRGL